MIIQHVFVNMCPELYADRKESLESKECTVLTVHIATKLTDTQQIIFGNLLH